MKTSNYILPAIIFAILLSSCGSLSISQKRYSRGLNIDLFSSKDEKQEFPKAKKTPKQKTVIKKQTPDAGIAEQVFPQDETPIYNSEIQSTPETSFPSELYKKTNQPASKKGSKHSKVIEKVSQKFTQKVNESKSMVSNIFKKNTAPDDTNNDSDVALIILVILALIPPLTLLAIYLYFGEINVHFWINLILLLLAGGVFLGGASIGLGLPIIHALLVVFGIFG